nr:MAG TPA: terminase small subunit [Caudoviricetes sp.]
MANIKPIALNTGNHNTKEQIQARSAAEERLKGSPIAAKAPTRLTDNGTRIYNALLESFPKGFLTNSDSHTLEIVANALDNMQTAQEDVNARGQLLADDSENPSIRIYEKYSKIFNTFGSKLGMSPKDRAALAIIMTNQVAEDEDPLLKAIHDRKKNR